MAFWLVKSEPTVYSFDQLVADGSTEWTGIRNAQARIFLTQMRVGDEVLYYHSQVDKAVVGIARVVREPHPDPTAEDPRWLAVDLAPVRKLARPIPLAEFRADELLAQTYLVKQGRLSVMGLSAEQWARVLALEGA